MTARQGARCSAATRACREPTKTRRFPTRR
jgi:hypothetical protein